MDVRDRPPSHVAVAGCAGVVRRWWLSRHSLPRACGVPVEHVTGLDMSVEEVIYVVSCFGTLFGRLLAACRSLASGPGGQMPRCLETIGNLATTAVGQTSDGDPETWVQCQCCRHWFYDHSLQRCRTCGEDACSPCLRNGTCIICRLDDIDPDVVFDRVGSNLCYRDPDTWVQCFCCKDWFVDCTLRRCRSCGEDVCESCRIINDVCNDCYIVDVDPGVDFSALGRGWRVAHR